MLDAGYLSATLLVLLGTAAGVCGLLLVRRWAGVRTLRAHHDVAAALLSVVGTLYAVLLGLVVVDAMEDFEEAREAAVAEENALANLLLLAERLPEPKRAEVRRLAVTYGRRVVEDEWPRMDDGTMDRGAHEAAVALVRGVLAFEPATEGEKVVYPAAIAAATELWNARHARAVIVAEGIPALEWLVLIAGGVVTVAFTYCFVMDRLWLQAIMTALLSMSISLNLVMMMLFGYPYSGSLKVTVPESYRAPADLLGPGSTPDPARPAP